MRKKIGTLLIIGSLGALCAGLAACSNDSAVDKYFNEGNVIKVTYDASGGKVAGNDNVKLMDMFNPDKFTADSNGIVKIKLREPTDTNRPKPNAESITVVNGNKSLVGWYRERTKDENGEYTYSKPWNFDTDYVEYDTSKKGEQLEFTLYAAWIPQYTFEYYYQEEGEWTQYETTSFDFLTVTTDEAKTLSVPDWDDKTGRMNYKTGTFTFPSKSGKTFKAAYADESCTEKKTSFVHPGELDKATAKADNTVQKIYVEFYEGNHYHISKAEQLVNIRDLAGHYTIVSSELDFEGKWPSSFLNSEFKGTIEGEDGAAVTFKNVSAEYSVTSNASYGGLFGKLCSEAKIKNVTFENANLAFKKAVNSRSGGSFGLFAGEIDDGATVENVTVGGELQLWDIYVTGGKLNLNLTANMTDNILNAGEEGYEPVPSPVANGGIKIKVCGTEVTFSTYKGKFEYFIDPEKTTVNKADGSILITLLDRSNQNVPRAARMKEDKEYDIVYGGEKNE